MSHFLVDNIWAVDGILDILTRVLYMLTNALLLPAEHGLQTTCLHLSLSFGIDSIFLQLSVIPVPVIISVSSTSWRVSPSVHCRAWCRITLPATVSWLPIPDGDPCGPPSDVSALCHVKTALSMIDPSRLPVRGHQTSCHSVYVTLGYR